MSGTNSGQESTSGMSHDWSCLCGNVLVKRGALTLYYASTFQILLSCCEWFQNILLVSSQKRERMLDKLWKYILTFKSSPTRRIFCSKLVNTFKVTAERLILVTYFSADYLPARRIHGKRRAGTDRTGREREGKTSSLGAGDGLRCHAAKAPQSTFVESRRIR